jgi:four helix bundle protein
VASGQWPEGTIVTLKHYRELIVWQKAMDLAEAVYRLTRKFPREEMFALTSQLRRAVVSIPSNIAEGQGRGGTKEFMQFLGIANGSLQEVETQLILSDRFNYITTAELNEVLDRCSEVGRVNQGLMRSLVRRG